MPLLDWRSAASAGAMAGIYYRLLKRIAASPQAVLERRVSLSTREKALVAARSLGTALRPRTPRTAAGRDAAAVTEAGRRRWPGAGGGDRRRAGGHHRRDRAR